MMAKQNQSITYEQSGVSINAGDALAKRIVKLMKTTHDERVIPNPMGFAALVRGPKNLNLSVVIGFGQRIKRDYNFTKAKVGEIPAGAYIL